MTADQLNMVKRVVNELLSVTGNKPVLTTSQVAAFLNDSEYKVNNLRKNTHHVQDLGRRITETGRYEFDVNRVVEVKINKTLQKHSV